MARTCTEINNRLEMGIDNEPGYREVGYELKQFVVAAFKAEIDFSSFSATVGGSVEAGFKMEYRIDDSNYVSVERYATGGGADGYRSRICIAGSVTTETVSAADASGQLKIERTGMIVRTYYYTGGAYVEIDALSTFDTGVGKLKIVTHSGATGVITAYADDFVFQESTNSIYDGQFVMKQKGSDKISVSRRGHRDYKNKVTVQYTKRGYGYMAGTIDSQDLVDIDANGVMDVAMRLEGLCTLSRAEKMGRLFLKKNINQCEVYAGTLGPQSFGTAPGAIVYLSSKRLNMSNVPARVLAVKEGPDYQLEVEFSEEKEIYELDTYAWDNTAPIPYTQYNVDVAQTLHAIDVGTVGSIAVIRNISGAVQSLQYQDSTAWLVTNPNELYISGAAQTTKVTEAITITRPGVIAIPAVQSLQYQETITGVVTDNNLSISTAVDRVRTTECTFSAQTTYTQGSAWTYGTNAADMNFRMIISAANLTYSGSSLRVKIKAHNTNDQTLTGVSIGERSGTTIGTVSTPKRITFNGGSSGVTVYAGIDKWSDPIAFNIDETKEYLIHVCQKEGASGDYAYAYANGRYYKGTSDDDTLVQTPTGYSTSQIDSHTSYVVNIEVNGVNIMMEHKSTVSDHSTISELAERTVT
jgi:hypothetical protein